MGNICISVNNVPNPRNLAKRKRAPTKKVDVAIIGTDENGLKTINEYKVIKELGECSFGTVSIIVNADQNSFAMKTTQRKHFSNGPVQISSEVATLTRLHHPNVIKLYEVIDDIRHPEMFLIFEYAEDGPVMKLDEYGTALGGPLELARAKSYISQIVEGLVHLHKNNVLHGDIQPENILLDASRSTVKLSNFRVAHLFQGEDDTISHTFPIGGNPLFMAPEMCRAARVPVKVLAATCVTFGH